MRIFSRVSVLLAATLAGWLNTGFAADPAADVMLLTGRGTAASPAGTVRLLEKGQGVFAGELITTGANSYLNLRFRDGSFILLRPNSRFLIEDFVYTGPAVTAAKDAPQDAESASGGRATEAAPAPAAVAAPKPVAAAPAAAPAGSRAFFKLLRGGFRAVSGLIGKGDSADYRVSTPVATIGIRGTDYTVVLVDPAMINDPVLRAAFPNISADGGLVVGVVSGQVFSVNNTSGTSTDIATGQFAFELPSGEVVMLPFEPQFLRLDPIPDPVKSCN